MVAFNISTQRLLTGLQDGNTLKPGGTIKPHRLLGLLLQAMGFVSVTIQTTPPGDVRTLWYNKDTDTIRRYNPVAAQWENLVPQQYFLHMLQIAFRAAGVEGIMDDVDKLPFFDVSADETKMISVADLKASLGISGWVPYATQILDAPSQVIDFALPFSFNDFSIRARYNSTESPPTTNFRPRLIGVYPTNAQVDITNGEGSGFSGVISNGGGVIDDTWIMSGDRSDLTGCILRQKPQGGGQAWPLITGLTNRIARVRYVVPNEQFPGWSKPGGGESDWKFTIGSRFDLFVR